VLNEKSVGASADRADDRVRGSRLHVRLAHLDDAVQFDQLTSA
jgi:hypothetical protein